MSDDLRDQINKRFTLNLLIQGAATHSFLTAHYLVKDELDEINPKLVPLYDKVSVAVILALWYGDFVLLYGRPTRFWKRIHRPGHPFGDHPLLVEHGEMLAAATKSHALARAREKGVATTPGLHYIHSLGLLFSVTTREARQEERLAALAKRATHLIWGIDVDRLDAAITGRVEFGRIPTPSTFTGRIIRLAAAGYSGVVRQDEKLMVVAKAWVWPLLAHELVKGTAELVCLHGLNTLDRETYLAATAAADKIEYEIWLMQAGAELWRRFLTVVPPEQTLAEALMHTARLSPDGLDRLMRAVIADPVHARRWLAKL